MEKTDTNLSNEQNNALHLAKNVLTKLGVTGVQKILNSIVFDVLKMIVVFPVEDETKLSNKDGQVLPDAKLLCLLILPQRTWHLSFIKILVKDSYMQ